MKAYNRIVLIGNGFDRAAGLNTSYANFIDSFIENAVIEFFSKWIFESDLISIRKQNIQFSQSLEVYIKGVKERKSAKKIIDFIKNVTNIKFKFEFFEEIINSPRELWVDIEQFYFNKLKSYYKNYKLNPQQAVSTINSIIKLNKCMDILSRELDKYISIIDNSASISYLTSPLASLIDKCHEPLRMEIAKLVARHRRVSQPTNVIFLNFNYTNKVISLTSNSFVKENIRHFHIHGKAGDKSNPIIFGYGDDTGDEYQNLEREGKNDFIRKIKSFQYPRTRNYYNLLNIIGSIEYDVFVIGHSCGLSDRTLLKTIFEHPNCMAIQNFHYKGESEDFNKRMEISRHFTDKFLMRERVLPYDEMAKIPQTTK